MRILGIGDGWDAGACLVVDNQVIAAEAEASFDGQAHSRAFPWRAVADVLRRGGIEPADVQSIAIAGRITPPFLIRRHPWVRKLFGSSFSSSWDLGVFYQAMLRQTGLAALEADRAADWLADRFEAKGFGGRLFLVDVHTALANAAYRTQDGDDVLIITLHPLGDGVSFAVHHGLLGQIDRLFEQKGFSTLQLHLVRCAEALRFPDVAAMWEGVGADVDPELVAALSTVLHLDHHKLSHARFPLPQSSYAYALLESADPAVGAASVRANLSRAITGLVRFHVRQHDLGNIVLAGSVFNEPRLVADIAAIPEVVSVACPADTGAGSLALGAAAYAGGIRMASDQPGSLDPALPSGGEPTSPSAIAEALRQGGRVAVYTGRSGLLPPGDRQLWSLEGAGRPASLAGPATALSPALACGSAYPPIEGGELVDGRTARMEITRGPLHAVLSALEGSVRLSPLGATPIASVTDLRRQARVENATHLLLGGVLTPIGR